ncbi:MAG: DUF1993 family protein [Sphingopyxis terrae]|nr:DUF1993 family protein [Sphingopyxis terrae]
MTELVEHDQVEPRQLRRQGPAFADPGLLFEACHQAYRSLAEIRQRIAAVRSHLETAAPTEWADADSRVDLKLPNGVRFLMSSEEDIRDWIMPNLYFHVTMVYALLRNAGLAIGKMDFMPHMARHKVAAE